MVSNEQSGSPGLTPGEDGHFDRQQMLTRQACAHCGSDELSYQEPADDPVMIECRRCGTWVKPGASEMIVLRLKAARRAYRDPALVFSDAE